MKHARTVFVLLAAAAALLLSPFQGHDAAKHIPVQTLCFSVEDDLYRVETDGGQYGLGRDPAAALADLERTAPGIPTLSTARQMVVDKSARDRLPDLVFLEALHPGTEVYLSENPLDAGDVTNYLNRHASGVSVSRLRSALLMDEPVSLPQIVGAEGRYRIHGSQ